MQDLISRGCAEISRYVGLDQEDKQRLREASQFVLPQKDKIMAEIIEGLQKDPEGASHLQSLGLDNVKSMLEQWMTAIFYGNYDMDHCMAIAKMGFTFAGAGIPLPTLLSKLAFVTHQVISRIPKDSPYLAPLLKSVHWSLRIIVLGYDVMRQRLFDKVLGINEGLYKRLQTVTIKDLMKELGVE
jgi:hypothetical protein